MPMTLAPHRVRGILLTMVIIVGGAPGLPDRPAQRTRAVTDESDLLRQKNASLKKQYELASGNSFYLMVDPSGADMTLAYRGAALHQYSILDVQLAVPRVAFIGSSIRHEWAGTIWSGGLLDPQRPSDRVVLKVSNTGAASEPSPPPDTDVSAPAVFLVRYEPGLVVEIRRSTVDSSGGWKRVLTEWRTRGREALAALSPSDRKLLRLRIVLTSDDADSLYRSLPPETKLLIVTGRRPTSTEGRDALGARAVGPSSLNSHGETVRAESGGPDNGVTFTFALSQLRDSPADEPVSTSLIPRPEGLRGLLAEIASRAC
jgi:hypothetical protein